MYRPCQSKHAGSFSALWTFLTCSILACEVSAVCGFMYFKNWANSGELCTLNIYITAVQKLCYCRNVCANSMHVVVSQNHLCSRNRIHSCRISMVMKLMHLVVAVLSLAHILEMLIMKTEFTRVQAVDRAGQWHNELVTW